MNIILQLVFASLLLITSITLFINYGWVSKEKDGANLKIPRLPNGKYTVYSDVDKNEITFVSKDGFKKKFLFLKRSEGMISILICWIKGHKKVWINPPTFIPPNTPIFVYCLRCGKKL